MRYNINKKQLFILTIFLGVSSFISAPKNAAGNPVINLEKITGALSSPVFTTHAGDGSGRLFIVEQPGRILILKNGQLMPAPFLNIKSKVNSGGEKGLLSVAFHPDFASNRRFFVNYTAFDTNLKTVVAEYRAKTDNKDEADSEEKVVIEIDQPFGNHNGGQIQFGPDGFLYIGMGDGGSGGDPLGHGQNKGTLLGSLLRIDVDNATPYSVPTGNPFVDKTGLGEIWAYGLRNPWRFSFDRQTGKLFLADVGQNSFEEVNIIEKGGNYGWNIMEGLHCFQSVLDCDRTGLIPPITEYSHAEGNSITGGYVYRGTAIPELAGKYLFADFVSSTIWTIEESLTGTWTRSELLQTQLSISSFGEDETGEIYVVDLNGAIYKIASDQPPSPTPEETPEPPDNKIFTFKCNTELQKAHFTGIERLNLDVGDTENCVLALSKVEPGVQVEISTKISGNRQSIKVEPAKAITDANGEIPFTITAINKGVDWIAWAAPNDNGTVRFNKKAFDAGLAWGMFVEVE